MKQYIKYTSIIAKKRIGREEQLKEFFNYGSGHVVFDRLTLSGYLIRKMAECITRTGKTISNYT
ncbi:hypothetical protein HMPREF9372_1197 [Sporosarcina newyorkensis 2681]|uniref:Uncharacterized protein n=1 Tax=Sporosarcina newyorkensis 2681 TaxID=1027292 RepID=F9DQW7_9BACL|nr:hypothetical protein HMPREF9372_1197 [Sporosarcina newyorkensis 2681]